VFTHRSPINIIYARCSPDSGPEINRLYWLLYWAHSEPFRPPHPYMAVSADETDPPPPAPGADMKKRLFVATLGALSLFALSACSWLDPDGPRRTRNDTAQAPAAPASASATPTESTPSAPAPPPAATPGLKVASTPLGQIITDAKGRSLYLFTKDTAKPSKPTCYQACAQKWPAYPWSENLTIAGIDKALVGKVQRTDGTWQLTIGGWPTYTYTGDTKAGDTAGHGVGSTWYAITPQGKKVAAKADNGGGYSY
jgi:predicted lipoprotein with Yx(FWY)xxD motif